MFTCDFQVTMVFVYVCKGTVVSTFVMNVRFGGNG